MTLDASVKAMQAYRIISRASNDAALMQAGANLASLVTGGVPVIHLAVDGFCLGFQMTLVNDITDLYGRRRVTADAAMAYLRPNLGFIFGNLALDKGLGVAVPVLGLPFCYIFARALTWRLGTFFAATAALGGEIPRPLFLEKLAGLVAQLFPRGDFFFTLKDPDKEKFIALIAGLEGLSATQAEARITTALGVLTGEYEILSDTEPEAEEKPEPENAGMPEEITPPVLWVETGSGEDGPDAAAEIPVPPLADAPPAGAAAEPAPDTAPPAEEAQLTLLPLAEDDAGPEIPPEDAEAPASGDMAESAPMEMLLTPAFATQADAGDTAEIHALPAPRHAPEATAASPANAAAVKKLVGRPKGAKTKK